MSFLKTFTDDGEWECKVCLLIFRRRDNLVRHLKNIHPEAPLIISTKQINEKDTDENVDESEKRTETCGGNSNWASVTNAVSVIRGPVIRRVSYFMSRFELQLQPNQCFYVCIKFSFTG